LAVADLFDQPTQPKLQWVHVRGRFRAFIENLAITPAQREGEKRQAGFPFRSTMTYMRANFFLTATTPRFGTASVVP
jgi:hypothetical protein